LGAAAVVDPVAANALLDETLPPHDDIRRGTLANGLKYVILPNKVPEGRFEAHLEMHVGSVDELPDEQGLAHLVEHVTFLGSRKRDQWLGSGTRGNAYTDFHHTVFHIHAPTTNKDGHYMPPNVFDILNDVAFTPQLLDSRVAKEKKAVLAEAQMMNTIEYRVDCQLLEHLHWDNLLGTRFPIGKLDQVEAWPAQAVRDFHARWYFPANATLYVVGDFDATVDEVEDMIETSFGEAAPAEGAEEAGSPLERHRVRPPVKHAYGAPSYELEDIQRANDEAKVQGSDDPFMPFVAPEGKVSMFQHEHLSNASFNIFSKLEIKPIKRMGDLHRTILQRIILLVLQSRMQARYAETNADYKRVELDHSDSAREGCCVSTVTVTCEPREYEFALQVAVEEARRLQLHGLTPSELDRFKAAMIRDSEQLAQQAGCVPSVENLDFVMEQDACGHVVMDQVKGHEALVRMSDYITLEACNGACDELLGFVGEYGVKNERRASSGMCTAIVACVPATMTNEHGETVPFDITPERIEQVLAADYGEIAPPEDIYVPEVLIENDAIDALIAETSPSFTAATYHETTGVYQRTLSNGIRVNYKVLDAEPGSAFLRLIVPGGRSAESPLAGAGGIGASAVGLRTVQEAGDVGDWSRKQIELLTMQHLLVYDVEPEVEYMFMDSAFATEGGLRTILEIIHLTLTRANWNEQALERVKDIYRMFAINTNKNIELLTHDTINKVIYKDERMMDPNNEALNALTLDGVREVVEAQFASGALELNIVGDFVPEELDDMLLALMGSIKAKKPATPLPETPPLELKDVAKDDPARAQRLWLKDSDERACAVAAGPGPSMWAPMRSLVSEIPSYVNQDAFTPEQIAALRDPVNEVAAAKGNPFAQQSVRRANALATYCAGMMLAEVIGGRLFTTVRDALGLTYDCNFTMSFGLQNNDATTYRLLVTSTPEKIDEAIEAGVRVLRGFKLQRVSQREVDRARLTLLSRHEMDSKTNAYWADLMQCTNTPDLAPLKTVQCIADLPLMYDAMTVDDLQEVYEQLGLAEGEMFTSVTIAGETEPPPYLSRKDVDAAALAAQTLTAAIGGMNLAEAIKKFKQDKSI
jgi:predicted Zn-dependent peptidase